MYCFNGEQKQQQQRAKNAKETHLNMNEVKRSACNYHSTVAWDTMMAWLSVVPTRPSFVSVRTSVRLNGCDNNNIGSGYLTDSEHQDIPAQTYLLMVLWSTSCRIEANRLLNNSQMYIQSWWYLCVAVLIECSMWIHTEYSYHTKPSTNQPTKATRSKMNMMSMHLPRISTLYIRLLGCFNYIS